jgi:uncharacterized delta-60 repeat protein
MAGGNGVRGRLIFGVLLATLAAVSCGLFDNSREHGSIDQSFTRGDGADRVITSMVVQMDGRIYITGDFTMYNGAPRWGIARLNPDGTLDTWFHPTFSAFTVYSIALQPDGKILVAGAFRECSGVPCGGLVRLNVDGSVDAAFQATGVEEGRAVSGVALQEDGKIVVCGNFRTFNGINRNALARLNIDGSLDPSFLSSGLGPSPGVNACALQDDGQILLAGLSEYNGTPMGGIGRTNADGSLDTRFLATGAGTNGTVFGLLVRRDGRILIWGQFTWYASFGTAGEYANGLALLNSDGTVADAFPDRPQGDLTYAQSVAEQQHDGKLLLSTWEGLYRLNSDASIDSDFFPPSLMYMGPVAVQLGGRILVVAVHFIAPGEYRFEVLRLWP